MDSTASAAVAPAFGVHLHGATPETHCEIVFAFAQFMRTIPAWVIDGNRYALGQILRDDADVDDVLHIELCDTFPACQQPKWNHFDEGSGVDALEGRYAELPECTFEQERYVTPYQLRMVLPLPVISGYRGSVKARLSPPRRQAGTPFPAFKDWLVSIPTERGWHDDPEEWLLTCDFARWARRRADFPEHVATFKQLVAYLATQQDGEEMSVCAAWAWAKYRHAPIGNLVARGHLARERGWDE
jgi:hypothetical protein